MCLAVKQGLILQMLKMLVWNNDYVGVRLDKFYKDTVFWMSCYCRAHEYNLKNA